MKWVKTPKLKCECIRAKSYEKVCDMHLRAGYGKFYKQMTKTETATGTRERAYVLGGQKNE